MKVWSCDYDAQYLLRVNCFRRFEYSTISIVPIEHMGLLLHITDI